MLVHLVGGAHNDGLMVAVAMAAIAAALTSRPALAGAGFVAAAAIKVSAVLYAPFALVGSRDRGRLVAGALAALALFAAVSLLAFGPHVSEAFSVAGGNQDRISRWSVPATLARITGADVDLFRVLAGIAYAAAVAALLVAVSRGLDWVRAAGWASFGLLIASAYMVPWYLIWLLPLAAISRRPDPDRCDDPADLVPGDQRSADMSGIRDMSGMSDRDEPRMRSSPEFELIAAIRERLAATAVGNGSGARIGIGDDAAVTINRPGATAVSVDALVDGVGFRRSWCPPRSIGRKAVGAALSDLAAMGATPAEIYVWLGMPADFGRDDCLELCDGLAELAVQEGAAVLGGDLTASGVLAVCVTAVGHAGSADAMIGRSGAEPGYAVCVTGSFGGAAAGLMLLEHPELREGLSERVEAAVTTRQLGPEPRLAAGRALAAGGARAMIDVSDGLGAEAEHLAAASGVGIEIEVDHVPRGEGVSEVADAAGRDPYELIVSGGEDYELLCVIPRGALADCQDAVEASGTELHEIGRVVTGHAVRLRLPGGRSVPVAGHDHFRGF